MAAGRATDDRSFDWPPTNADLARIDVMSGPAPTTAVAAGPRVTHARSTATRLTGRRAFGRADGLLLIAAGMLLGAAVPSLDSAPPTRLGLRAGMAGPTSSASPLRMQAPPVAAPPASPPTSSSATATTPAGTTPAASAPAVATASASVPRRTPPPGDARTRQVIAAVQAFGRAWTRLDARAASAVMPSADVEDLVRDFTGLREQRLTLTGCRVSGTGASAVASCAATRRYRPRQGDHSTRVERGRWRFHLERVAQRWIITGLES